jgi:hypothetical protein
MCRNIKRLGYWYRFKLKILSNEIWQKLKNEDEGFRFG